MLFGGAVASMGLEFFDRSELPSIKTVVYMRAIQSIFLLLRQKLAFMQPDNENGFEMPAGDYFLAGFGVMMLTMSLYHEVNSMPLSIKNKVLDLVQATHNEKVEIKAFDAVNVANIERIYGKRIY